MINGLPSRWGKQQAVAILSFQEFLGEHFTVDLHF